MYSVRLWKPVRFAPTASTQVSAYPQADGGQVPRAVRSAVLLQVRNGVEPACGVIHREAKERRGGSEISVF